MLPFIFIQRAVFAFIQALPVRIHTPHRPVFLQPATIPVAAAYFVYLPGSKRLRTWQKLLWAKSQFTPLTRDFRGIALDLRVPPPFVKSI